MSRSATLHSSGKYRFLADISAYSAGVAAEPGHELIGVHFDEPLAVAGAFSRLDEECAERGVPIHALVAVALRSPLPFEFGTFDEFNHAYRKLLADRGLLEGDTNPIARTNVVPVLGAPREPVLLSAFLVREATGHGGTDFVVSGGAELDDLRADAIVARGDISSHGLERKAAHVIEEMRSRSAALGHDPQAATEVNVYTAHEVPGLTDALLARLPGVAGQGFRRWIARPPVTELEFEMDIRRVTAWQVL